ncbi:MAG: ParB/RepB/Spo0J family partition protein [Clostridiales bacterium]|nr:ParB/RepB/Spo0J family partition protein [Clostridiales bacterium]
MATVRKGGLGRGLGALLGDIEEESVFKGEDGAAATSEMLLEEIEPNADQPRKEFDDNALAALAESIKKHGVITPLVVTPRADGKYMIIAGERRYRAAKAAGLLSVPVFVRDCTPVQIDELSLIENIQREDLNPLEVAQAIKKLMDDYGYTQERAAERIGKARPTVANLLRILDLSDDVQKLVSTGRLSAGHARCLVVVTDEDRQYELAIKGCDDKMSVREFEKFVKNAIKPKAKPAPQQQSLELKDMITRMQRTLGTKVTLLGNDKKGRIFIDYYTPDDLERIESMLSYLESNYKN